MVADGNNGLGEESELSVGDETAGELPVLSRLGDNGRGKTLGSFGSESGGPCPIGNALSCIISNCKFGPKAFLIPRGLDRSYDISV